MLKNKYVNRLSYSTVTLTDISGSEWLTSAKQAAADECGTGIVWKDRGRLVFKPLPFEAQNASLYATEAADLDKDGRKDLISGGDTDRTRVRLGKMDFNKGQAFLNLGNRNFRGVSHSKSGLSLSGEVRSVSALGPYLPFGINHLPVQG